MPVKFKAKYRLINIAEILVVLMCIYIFIFFYFNSSLTTEKMQLSDKSENLNGNVDIIFKDGTTLSKKVPFKIETDQPFKVIFYLDSIKKIEGQTLSFMSKAASLYAEVDGNNIYKNILTFTNSTYKDGDIFYYIDLPKHIRNNKITLNYIDHRNHTTEFVFENIKIGKKIDIVSDYFLESDLRGLLYITLLLVVFLAITMTGGFLRRNAEMDIYFNNISILCLIFAIHIASIMPLSYFAFYNASALLNLLKHSTFMIMPIFLLKAVLTRIDGEHSLFVKIGIIIASANFIIQHILTSASINRLSLMNKYTYIVILYSVTTIVYSIIRTKNNELNQIYKMLLSISPLLIALTEKSIRVLTDRHTHDTLFFKILFFIFLILQCYEVFNTYMKNKDQKVQTEIYKKLALLDNLTGLENRLAFSQKTEDYKNTKKSFFCIIIDIDRLKHINDHYGHKYGDMIIKSCADILTTYFPTEYPKDIFRIGGDEFAIIYYAPKNIEIKKIMDNLKNKYKNLKVIEGVDFLSFSYGYSYYEENSDVSFEKIFEIADKNMYKNKKLNALTRIHFTQT